MAGFDSTFLARRSFHEGPSGVLPLYFPVTTFDYRSALAGRGDIRLAT